MELATRALREERLARGIPIEPEIDPDATGLIGPEDTAITTTLGYLPAKRTSTNSNMARCPRRNARPSRRKTRGLRRRGIFRVFPRLEHRSALRLQAMELKPVIVSSVGALQLRGQRPSLHLARHGAGSERTRPFPLAVGCG